MLTLLKKPACLAVMLAAAAVPLQAAVPAFPGAEGPGATATGGRGGDVYHVTNLSSDLTGVIPGSFQYGMNNAPTAGRTIVFDVGGTIYLAGKTAADTLRYGKSNITVAGQTAPGAGITIAGTGTKWTGSNVILRNMTVRPNVAPVSYDAFSLQIKNSMVDHVTATWFTDEGISETDAGVSSTIQYANISEGLNNIGHAFGSIIATEVDGTSLSYHHNLYAHNKSRMPRLGSELGTTGALLNFSNNVIYNWSGTAGYSASDVNTGAQQPSSTNFINNYYLVGADNGSTIFTGAGNQTKIYQNGGNKKDSTKDGVFNGATVTQSAWTGTNTFLASPVAVVGATTADSADVGLQRTLDYGGANWQNRNPIDQRIVSSVRTSTGNVINDLTTGVQATEWAAVLAQRPDANGNAPFTRAVNYDTDRDGMPDAWEAAHGMNPLVATGSDGNNGLVMNDGYTNLEGYINEVGAFPAPAALVFNNANTTGRYAEIGNWAGGVFKPSRFDAAQVDAGTVKVDVVGQHANGLAVATSAGNVATLSVTGGWIDVNSSLFVGPGGTGTVNHSAGIVRAGTSVVIGGANNAGTYNLSGGTLAVGTLTKGTKGGAFNFTGGTLHANTVNFSFTNNGGILAPGSDAALQMIAAASMPDISGATEAILPFVGSTHVVGNLTLASGLLQIDLASLTNFDKIAVDGALSLGGGLAVVLDNGFTPVAGNQFLIGTAGSISNAFASITPGFTTLVSGGNLFLVTVPEPTSIAGLAVLGGFALRRRRTAGVDGVF